MLSPDPAPPLSIIPTRRRARALYAGHIIADSDEALVLREAGEPAWHFFPIDDVEMGFFGRTGHVVHSERKGAAATYTLAMEGDILEDVARVYDDPRPVTEALRGRVGFDPRRIEVYEIDEAELERADGEHPPGRLSTI